MLTLTLILKINQNYSILIIFNQIKILTTEKLHLLVQTKILNFTKILLWKNLQDNLKISL